MSRLVKRVERARLLERYQVVIGVGGVGERLDSDVPVLAAHGWKTPLRTWAVNARLTVVWLELTVLKE